MAKVLGLTLMALTAMVLGGGLASAQEGQESVQTVTLEVDTRTDDEGGTPVFVDGLESVAVLRIRASRFPANVTGTVRQCSYVEERSCANAQAVRFDDRGRADVQYLVNETVLSPESSGRCGPQGPRCTVEIEGGGEEAVADLLFGATAPDVGSLEVSPGFGLVLGDEVSLRAHGFPPGTALVATVCAAPAVRGDRCGEPAPEVPMVTDAAGDAEATMRLDVARVGADAVACGRRTTCQVVVLSDDVAVRARPVAIGLADAPGPDYDTRRLVVGLGVAAALLVLAGLLIGATDWRPPGEADASSIDETDYADLDAEADAFDRSLF